MTYATGTNTGFDEPISSQASEILPEARKEALCGVYVERKGSGVD